MEKEFYSNGKLLLSGEYAILDGALGLAIPTSYGQSLHVTPTTSGFLEWASLDENDEVWFTVKLDISNLEVISTSNEAIAKVLVTLLLEANTQNPLLLTDSDGFQIETRLTFPKSWGLGTSSTLINNLAQWARVDAYQLLWNAIFKDSLYFVHLNQKQSSKKAITNYREQQFDKPQLIKNISSITQKIINASTLSGFESLMEEHEALLSNILNIAPVKQQLFPDYFGMVKSLGAWGGDFVLATGDDKTIPYFKAKGYPTIIPYSKMVL